MAYDSLITPKFEFLTKKQHLKVKNHHFLSTTRNAMMKCGKMEFRYTQGKVGVPHIIGKLLKIGKRICYSSNCHVWE